MESIESLGTKDIEILVAVDEDEPALKEYYSLLYDNTSLITTPRYGYGYLERYYNDLARISTGEWLFLWNDDAVMGNKDWVDKITASSKKPHVAQFGEDKCFPLITRTLYNIMGHFSLGPSNDTYLLGVGDRAEIRTYFEDVNIYHKRDYIHDQTEGDKVQATSLVSKRQSSKECVEAQDEDARRVKEWQSM